MRVQVSGWILPTFQATDHFEGATWAPKGLPDDGT